MSTATKPAAGPLDPAIEKRVDALLKGAVDMHCHSGPSVMPRLLDHIDAVEEAGAAGMRALLFKDHYYSATPITELLNGRYARLGVQMLSGVPLNDTSGGLNPFAVDHGLKLGARLIWMPTFSAANHIRHNRSQEHARDQGGDASADHAHGGRRARQAEGRGEVHPRPDRRIRRGAVGRASPHQRDLAALRRGEGAWRQAPAGAASDLRRSMRAWPTSPSWPRAGPMSSIRSACSSTSRASSTGPARN